MQALLKIRELKKIKQPSRLDDVKRFGTQSMSYSALQDGIKEFRHRAFSGFVAYSSVLGVDYVLSNPVTHPQDYYRATHLFLRHRQTRDHDVVFCQINKDYADLLHHSGWAINGFGVEHHVDLDDFNVTWKVRRGLKRWVSKLSNQNYFVLEGIGKNDQIHEISTQWLKSKQNSKELRFLARPYVERNEADVRTFYLIKQNHILGFCTFDPVYSPNQSGVVTSYVMQHLRVCDSAPQGSHDFLLCQSLLLLKEEGIQSASLGLAPLYQRDSSLFRHSKLAEAVFQLTAKTKFLYHFKTVGEHKDRYRARKEQTYVATPHNFTLRSLCGLLKVNNLV